jgi:hypothetical protein
VRISHREADHLCRFLDPTNTGRVSLSSLVKALEGNEAMLHKRADLQKLPPPVQADNRHMLVDEVTFMLRLTDHCVCMCFNTSRTSLLPFFFLY